VTDVRLLTADCGKTSRIPDVHNAGQWHCIYARCKLQCQNNERGRRPV